MPPRRAGIAISAAWAVGLVVTNRSVHDLVDVFGAGGQMVALFALVAVSVPLILRRDRFDEMGLIA